jgi:hypothetical protein
VVGREGRWGLSGCDYEVVTSVQIRGRARSCSMHDSPCRGGGADAAAEAPSRHAADGIHHYSWSSPLELQSFKVETIT